MTGIKSMEPEAYFQYDLAITLEDAETYARPGLCPCKSRCDRLFPKERLDRDNRCPDGAAVTRRCQEANAARFRERYPDLDPAKFAARA